MGVYMVSYDLLTPGQNYEGLWNELRKLGAKRILQSQWILRHTASASTLRNHFQQFLDYNDRLFVNTIDLHDWAGWNILFDLNNL